MQNKIEKKTKIPVNQTTLLTLKSNQVKFLTRRYFTGIGSHTLLKIDDHQWLVLEHDIRGNGIKGLIYHATGILVIEGNQLFYSPCDAVVELQEKKPQNQRDEQEKALNVQIKFQIKQGINVLPLISTADYYAIVHMNCGQNIKTFLKENPDLSFNTRLKIATGVVSEMTLLERNEELVPRVDMENIYIKITSEHRSNMEECKFSILLLHFGLANNLDALKAKREGEHRRQMVATAALDSERVGDTSQPFNLGVILDQIFSVKNSIFDQRKAFDDARIRAQIADLALPTKPSPDYNLDSLFKGYNLLNTNYRVLESFKQLIRMLIQSKPSEQPSLLMINKFIILIPTRSMLAQALDKHSNYLNEVLPLVETELSPELTIEAAYLKELVSRTYSPMDYLQHTKMVLANPSTLQSDSVHPYENLELDLERLKAFNLELTKVIIQQVLNEKFAESNSLEVNQLQTILQSSRPTKEQLIQVKRIIKEKISTDSSSLYGLSSFFGESLQETVNILYNALAQLDVEDLKLSTAQTLRSLIRDNAPIHHAKSMSNKH